MRERRITFNQALDELVWETIGRGSVRLDWLIKTLRPSFASNEVRASVRRLVDDDRLTVEPYLPGKTLTVRRKDGRR